MNGSEKKPKMNWAQHAAALDTLSSQPQLFNSNFMYSLAAQKPQASMSSIACETINVPRFHNAQFEKAWQKLSSLQISCRSYIKPGKTIMPIKDAMMDSPQYGRRKVTMQCSTDGSNRFSEPMQTPQNFGQATSQIGNSKRYMGNQAGNFSANAGNGVGQQNEFVASNGHNSNAGDLGGPNGPRTLYNVQEKGPIKSSNNDMDDDDLLENIDVDQIVMQHYQSGGTPQPSVSKLPPITPTVGKSHVAGLEESCLPSELCALCSHGCKLGDCPEAANHLQEIKDTLISVSNELLDNASGLNPALIEKLRQDRLQLNKQIQQLETHLCTLSAAVERQNSHFLASTATPKTSQYQTPTAAGFRMDPMRFDGQGHEFNEPRSHGNWNVPPDSYSSVDTSGFSYAPVEREIYKPKYVEVNYIEGSGDKQWSTGNFPWTKKLEVNNKKIFGNHSFRPNQREVINATMSGCDVFVLMPTGGGKSLTYQLPALISPGITLVISPLVSLIQDQIMHLMQANIPAAYLSANMDWNEQQEILREISSDNCKFKLLYVTPEKVAKSDSLLRHLEGLYTRESLSRIVIDEAHCVSQWGHDFRPDYQSLGILKQKFPNTPVLALTATATASVKEDVVQALGLVNCIVFRQSFNRPNLWYSVIPKTKKCLDDIDKFIRENHFDECGIIYCLSRMDCEKVAERLQECGHKAAFYHGSMDPAKRTFVQKQWSKDDINIICATVAFGMGINKPDVRFVIHHSLPKSIEGYHQECGRAGRDGQRSSCVLYYNYSDYIRVKHMISQGATEQGAIGYGYTRTNMGNSGRILETNTENLLRMVSYCENNVDCRRLLQLLHFGEKFDCTTCRKTCDNCSKIKSFVEKDVTEIAKQLVELIKLTGQLFSSAHILEVYRGSLSQFVKKHRHEKLSLHGAGKQLAKGEASRVLRHLVTEDLIQEDVKKSDFYGSVSSVLKVNESKAYNLIFGGQKIILRFPSLEKASKISRSEATPAKGTLTPAPPQSEVDLNLSAKVYSALRILRSTLMKEAGEGVMAHHIFGNATLQQISKKMPRTKEELLEINGIGKAKLTKYGDRVLQTIEATINEYYRTDKTSSSSNDSNGSGKRRRDSTRLSSADFRNDNSDIIGSTGRLKKRALKSQKSSADINCIPIEQYSYDYFVDDDLDFDDSIHDINVKCSEAKSANQNEARRVLPSWSAAPGSGYTDQCKDAAATVIQEYAFKR